MTALAKRNLLVFYRDKAAVFFSLLSSLIIVGLYILFLGDTYQADYGAFPDVGEMIDSWVMAGLLATTSVSTTIGAFSMMVHDKELKIIKDFYSSPIARKSLAGGYVLSALIIGLVMSFATLLMAEIYIVANGGTFLGAAALGKVIGLILLADFTNASMMFLVTSFFTGNNAFSTASTVIGTLIGFLTGIYLPIGMLPEGVQWCVKLFPTSHAAALLRQVMMEESMKKSFAGAAGEYVTEFKHTMGVTFQFGNSDMNNAGSITYLLLAGAACFILAFFNLSRKKK